MEAQQKLHHEALIEENVTDNGFIKAEKEQDTTKKRLFQNVSDEEVAAARKKGDTDTKDKTDQKGNSRGVNAQEQELWSIAKKMSTSQKKVTTLRLVQQSRPERSILSLGILLTFMGAGLYLSTPGNLY
ncbi:hypothetical protein RFI_04245 [Reticulomyxa filosa]|uniref:Uncharacterized protein n=1 Tax=Reticulomyxa filosa TaxID=46433 RepID=X6P3X6_RETFI|nr:hypothetical protein RFI_04245 [Reticulomyxa filosa]|eukprot:ETO32871.1 hypothetical protein RFI_04245 [Reticulomyxa filosa]